MALLKEADVRRLRGLAAQGQLNVRLESQVLGVGAETIRRAVRGETWTKLSASTTRTEDELAKEAERSLAKLQELLAKQPRAGKMLDELGGRDAGYTEA